MTNLVSKCGIDCGTCPWGPFPRKDMTVEEFEKFRKKGKEILGFMPIKTPCVTCRIPDDEIPKTIKLPRKKCLIRQCVDKTGILNCAYCSCFPCDTLKATADLWNRKKIEGKLGRSISEKDYHSFVEPFEGVNRLFSIRSSLKTNEIIEPTKVIKSKTKIVEFPDNLDIKEDLAAYKVIHNLLQNLETSSLGLINADTLAQQHMLKTQKSHILRFLWIFGKHGKFEKEISSYILVDAKTYYDNREKEKTLSIWSFVKDVIFKYLSEFGVCCKLEVLKGTNIGDITTGTGYLRKKGWVMKMSFKDKNKGNAANKALKFYTMKLDERFRSRAFQHFREADMTILLDK